MIPVVKPNVGSTATLPVPAIPYQEPPPVVDDNDIVLPLHTAEGPLMLAGSALTVIGLVTKQPVAGIV